jgi:hypothetical protein
MRRIERYVAGTVWFSILLVLLVLVGIDTLSAFIDESGNRSDTYGFHRDCALCRPDAARPLLRVHSFCRA